MFVVDMYRILCLVFIVAGKPVGIVTCCLTGAVVMVKTVRHQRSPISTVRKLTSENLFFNGMKIVHILHFR